MKNGKYQVSRPRYLWILALLLIFSVGSNMVSAQDVVNPKSASISFELNELAGDFGASLGIQSPLILGHAAIRAEGVLQWYNDPGSAEIWYMYAVARAGLVGYSDLLANYIRLYGFGGVELVFPNLWTNYIDSEAMRFGGWGGFGFEFFFIPTGCYFIELGTTGSDAKSRIEPRLYRNGFQTAVGMRFYLN